MSILKCRRNRRAMVTIEYIVLLIIILFSIFLFRKYLTHGLSGKFKSVGDSFGMGRQFDPAQSTQCAFDSELQRWYDTVCYENLCKTMDRDCARRAIVTAPPAGCASQLCQREADTSKTPVPPLPAGNNP